PSTTLVTRLRFRDPEAWRRLVYLYAPLVYSWCRLAGLPETDATAVGQTIFASVFQALGTPFPDPSGGSFRVWLKALTRNVVSDFLCPSEGGQPGAPSKVPTVRPDLVPGSPAEEDPVTSSDELVLLRRAVELVLGDFEEDDRQAFRRVV